MSNRDKIISIVAPKLEELGCFLVDVKANTSNNKFEVYIDNMAGITIETCEKVSRFIEFNLDNDPDFPKQYSLDVSSPGMDNPFKVPQQYAKNISKTVEVVLNNGIKKEGILLSADDDTLVLQVHLPPKKKGMKPETMEETLHRGDIKATKKKISF